MSIDQVDKEYRDEQEYAQILYDAKWPDGFRCAKCGHTEAYHISTRRLPLYECRSCRAQTSLIVGTIMEGSRTSLSSWFHAIHLHSRPEGINALQLSTIISVTYKTAWLICHKIRHAMSRTEADILLTGQVNISPAIYSKQTSRSFSWQPHEQSLLIGASYKTHKLVTHIKIEKQDKQALKTVYASPDPESFIRRNVTPDAAATVVIAKLVGPTRNSQLIRIVRKAENHLAHLFGGIGAKHLQVYMDQFCYKWNRQTQSLFSQLVSHCALTRTINYRTLTGRSTKTISNYRSSRGRPVAAKLAG